MTKTRFTAADVRAMVRDLRSTVLGLRVVNVYDLDSKTYLFKLASPGQEKAVLLLESGVRFHTTKFNHTKSDMPSGFSMKLRKHVRTQRLEDVRQVGMDRVVDFKFGSGEASNHVILELYASGNIILTDYKYEILDLLRTHTYDGQDGAGGDVRVAVRQVYPVDLATTQEGTTSSSSSPSPPCSLSATAEAASGAVGPANGKETGAFSNGLPLETGVRRMSEWLQRAAEASMEASEAGAAGVRGGGGQKDGGGDGTRKKRGGAGGSKKSKRTSLKQTLMQKGSGVSVYGPSILEHCVLAAGLRPNAKLTAGASAGGGLSEDEIRRLVSLLGDAEEMVQRLDRPGQKGYIQCKELPVPKADDKKKDKDAKGEEDIGGQKQGQGQGQGDSGGVGDNALFEDDDNVVFEEFLPQLLAQHDGAVVREFPSFDQAVDAFFGRIVEQKLKQAAIAAEAAVEKKVEVIRRDQERRVQALEERQEKMLWHAQLAEAWADEVEKALMVVRSALANGMDWTDLDALVQTETANGNPVASLIHELRLDRNQVVLALPTADGGNQMVEMDMMLSAHANARLMYENKKLARAKELKTLEAAGKVLKIAEQQAQKTLQRQAHKRSLQVARKTHWFEKFNWFITSENYLVVSGRDAQQNEVVVKKYLRPGDIYVHADLHGASSCVLRNKDPSGKHPVSPLALEEAGCMTVCRSAAWGAKMVTSAWWVYADQVSKTAPTGEYLVTGSFMVRGRKNFLPPRPLEMGFALLFKLDDASLAAHAGERREKTSGEEEGEEGRGNKEALLPARAEGGRRSGEPGAAGGVEDGGEDSRARNDRGRAVHFDAPLGLGDQRRDNGSTSGARDPSTSDARRVAALAALAGVGAGASSTPLFSAAATASRNQPGLEEEGGEGTGLNSAVEGRQPEPTKKRLSAKERKLAKKGGAKEVNSAGPGASGDKDRDGEARVAAAGEEREAGASAGADDVATSHTSVPRGKRGKLKRMKKKYADQDEEDRKLALEALGLARPEDGEDAAGTGGGANEHRQRRHREGDRKEAAAAEAAAEAAISKSLRKAETELAAALEALDESIRDRLEEILRPDELDPFEVRALGKFDVVDAMDILARFAEADLRRVRNRSGFLAGIMRKHGSLSASSGKTPKEEQQAAVQPPAPPATAEEEEDHPMRTTRATADPAAAGAATSPAAGEEVLEAAEASGAERVLAEAGVEGGRAGKTEVERLQHQEQDQQKQEQEKAQIPYGGNGSGGSGERAGAEKEAGDGGSNVDGDKAGAEEAALSRRAQKRREDEEVRKLLEEEGGGENLDGFDGEEGAAAAAAAVASELDRLTGKPREEDVLLFAVPVCGPYMSLRDYRYKVKLTPGKQKRGKASKQAIEVFSRTRDTPASHKVLMKSVTDNECVAAMIGDVKVSVAGLAQATQAKKKSNKQQAKKDPNKQNKAKKPKAGKGKK